MWFAARQHGEAFETYGAPDYVQHNPGIADGREAAVATLADMFADPAKEFIIERLLVDGDRAAIHIHAIPAKNSRRASVFDMYRLKEEKIVEHPNGARKGRQYASHVLTSLAERDATQSNLQRHLNLVALIDPGAFAHCGFQRQQPAPALLLRKDRGAP